MTPDMKIHGSFSLAMRIKSDLKLRPKVTPFISDRFRDNVVYK